VAVHSSRPEAGRLRVEAVRELVIDGALGEGGGQIVRTALTLSAVLGRPIRIENVRAGRRNPGLAAQHLAAVHAAAAACAAETEGVRLGSTAIAFTPRGAPRAGSFRFDVAEGREGGSAGAATLVLQALLVVLATADGESSLVVHGGTHVAWSPPADYLLRVWLPALHRVGLEARVEEVRTGWFPAGGGELRASVRGGRAFRWRALAAEELGALVAVRGRALAASLPAHVADRMAARARSLLAGEGIAASIEAERVRADGPGACLFLVAEYERACAGFSALGERGKSAERVAEEAVARLVAHRRSGAALDVHLADQVLLPAALAEAPSTFTVERVSAHLRANARVVELFERTSVEIDERADGTGRVVVRPR